MKSILTLAIAALALGTIDQRASLAQGPLPWCELGVMTGNEMGNCSFYTFAQCMQTAWGDGRCERNPRFDALYYKRGLTPPVDFVPDGPPPRPYRK